MTKRKGKKTHKKKSLETDLEGTKAICYSILIINPLFDTLLILDHMVEQEVHLPQKTS